MAKTSEAFAVTDRVAHSDYGLGRITAVNPTHTTIEFDAVGVKKFVTSLVRLKHSDVPAPAKSARGTRAKKPRKS